MVGGGAVGGGGRAGGGCITGVGGTVTGGGGIWHREEVMGFLPSSQQLVATKLIRVASCALTLGISLMRPEVEQSICG